MYAWVVYGDENHKVIISEDETALYEEMYEWYMWDAYVKFAYAMNYWREEMITDPVEVARWATRAAKNDFLEDFVVKTSELRKEY